MSNISTIILTNWIRYRISSGAVSELKGSKLFLKYTGGALTPDSVKETLRLEQSGATLGRKFRQASEDLTNPELLKSYYATKNGRRVVVFSYNPNYKEIK